jgi:heme exporter protein C
VLVPVALALIFLWVPEDADQGFSQKIFFFHVPIALTAYVCFGWGAWKALRHLWKRERGADLESYTAIHQGVIFGVLTLVTGSIWAKASWGVWWTWSSNQLVLFLVLFLFYCAYFMLRFSVEAGERRATFSAVYAVLGVGLIPLSVIGVHVAQTNDLIHPITFNENGANMDGSMFLTFLVALAAMITLSVTMYLIELRGKRIDDRLRAIRRLAGGEA